MTKEELMAAVEQSGYPICIENGSGRRFKILDEIVVHNAKSKGKTLLCVYSDNGERFTKTHALFKNDLLLANSSV